MDNWKGSEIQAGWMLSAATNAEGSGGEIFGILFFLLQFHALINVHQRHAWQWYWAAFACALHQADIHIDGQDVSVYHIKEEITPLMAYAMCQQPIGYLQHLLSVRTDLGVNLRDEVRKLNTC